jgi:hypothetical protein
MDQVLVATSDKVDVGSFHTLFPPLIVKADDVALRPNDVERTAVPPPMMGSW